MEGYDFKPWWLMRASNSSWKDDGKVFLNLLGIPPKVGFEGRTWIIERNNERSSAQMIMCVWALKQADDHPWFLMFLFATYFATPKHFHIELEYEPEKSEIIYQISRIGSPAIRFDSPGLLNWHSRQGSSPHKMQQNDWHTGRTKLFDINSA